MSGGPFAPFLDAHGCAVLDGGLATALEQGGYTLDTPLWSARALLEAPDRIRAVHASFLEAGADCVTSAGYQASFDGLRDAGLDSGQAANVMRRAVSLAVEARDAFWEDPAHRTGRSKPVVAASAGPYGAFLADGSEYDGRYGVDSGVLERFHESRLDVLLGTSADVLAFETVPSLAEAEVVARLLGARPGARAWISFSCRDSERLWDGSPVTEAVDACGSAAAALVAVGVNCTAPWHVAGLIERIGTRTDLPIVAYPNSGEIYDAATGSWRGPPASWIGDVAVWVAAGARIVGGCCRVGPAEIRELRTRLEELHAR